MIQKLASCWNLSDADVFRLRNTKELSVYRDDSCLAFGKISDVFRETVQEGTITTVAFSLGLDEPGICLKLTIEEVVWTLEGFFGEGGSKPPPVIPAS